MLLYRLFIKLFKYLYIYLTKRSSKIFLKLFIAKNSEIFSKRLEIFQSSTIFQKGEIKILRSNIHNIFYHSLMRTLP